jgi:prepilin-type processing-associated H-X9-DG protein
MQCVGNVWGSVCCGPQTSDGAANGWGNNFQIDTAAPTDAAKLATGGYCTGQLLYKAHQKRFNYAFHDGHVEVLKIEDTIGNPPVPPPLKLRYPAGMWTVIPGD